MNCTADGHRLALAARAVGYGEKIEYSGPTYESMTIDGDRVTLRFVDAVELPQHENSFLTIEPNTMTAYTMDHFDGNTLLRYDVTHNWKRLSPLHLSTTLHHTQGADVLNGVVWISTSDPQNDLYGVDLRDANLAHAKVLDLFYAKLCHTTLPGGSISNRNC